MLNITVRHLINVGPAHVLAEAKITSETVHAHI